MIIRQWDYAIGLMLRPFLSVILWVVCPGVPAWAAAVDMFNPDQPFREALSLNFLRSLFNQALDQLEDHVKTPIM